MSGPRPIVGTVRAARGGRHVVVGRDGSATDVLFRGAAAPLVGADVVGTVVDGGSGPAMELHRTVTDAVLAGRARISPAGSRPEVTARMLAKLLSRSRGVIAPGEGVTIERAPTTDDPDLMWAISAFRAEADRTSTALNVVDVRAVSRAPWRTATLSDLTLPADVEGNTRAMRDLKRLLATGFHPDCNRMVERLTESRFISVNFVVPYSPFAGATAFARANGFMDRGFAARPLVSLTELRRITAARHVALGLAHSALGVGSAQADVGQSRRAAHLASSFADAAATLAFLADGGREGAVRHYADLKLASLHFGRRPGRTDLMPHVLVEATAGAVMAAMEARSRDRCVDAASLVAEAARIARRTALPASRFSSGTDMPSGTEAVAAAAAAGRVAVPLRNAGRDAVELAATHYRVEIGELVDEHASDPLAAARLRAFAAMDCPLALAGVFDEQTRRLPALDPAPAAPRAERSQAAPARRLRAAASVPEPDEFDMIEIGEPLATPAP